jgi:hypothetical protein
MKRNEFSPSEVSLSGDSPPMCQPPTCIVRALRPDGRTRSGPIHNLSHFGLEGNSLLIREEMVPWGG